jgi:glycosyltransferase involved in cell wall biosynthesis
MSKKLVSVIVPTKNAANTIEICLRSIKNQTYPDIELIVVDNYSDDGTSNIARRFAKVYYKRPERSAQRNEGAKIAKGDYLVFIDSDMELSPEVIEESVHKISRNDIDVIIIPEISVGQGFLARCKALERSCYIGDDTIEAARFFNKEVFMEMNGYDETINGGGEDWDLQQRIRKTGHKTGRIKSLILHNEGRLRLKKAMEKKYYYGKTIRRHLKKNPEIALKQVSLIRLAYVKHWRRLARYPIYTIGFMFLKCCEFAAGGLGLIVGEVETLK